MVDKKVSIMQVAEHAGVSLATVSRVLNHPEVVKDHTLQKVLNAMKALGFESDPIVNAQRKNKGLIIFNLPSFDNPFYNEVIKGARASASAHGYHLLADQNHIDFNNIEQICDMLKSIRASGIITTNCIETPVLRRLSSAIPTVQCAEYNSECPEISYVSVDDFRAARTVMDHIISVGRRKVAMLNGPLRYKYARERRHGFEQSLESRGISIPSNWIVQLPDINYNIAYSAVCQLLSGSNIPNAIFTVSDVFAIGAIRAANRFNLSVPKDIVITGFDNVGMSTMSTPPLTTVNQPKYQMGFTACEFLVEKLQNPDSSPGAMLLDIELIIRESSSVKL